MKRYLLSLVTLLPIYACTPQSADDETTATSGGSGGNISDAGGSEPTGASQASSSGGSAGEGGKANTEGSTVSGGSAGESSTEGSGGSETSSGGASGNTGGSSSVGGSDAGGSGGSSTNGSGGFEVLGELDPIIGPAEDDPGYIEVATPPIIFRCSSAANGCKIGVDGEGFYVYNGTEASGSSPNGIVKRDQNFEVVWAIEPYDLAFDDYSEVVVTAVDVNQDGEVLFAGCSRENAADDYDIVTGKLDPDGNLIWRDVWGSNGDEYPRQVIFAPNDNFLVVSDSNGQAPGNPPDNAGHPVLAWYAPDNERQALYQVSYAIEFPHLTLLHNDGTSYTFNGDFLLDGFNLAKTDPDGTETSNWVLSVEDFSEQVRWPEQMAFNSDQTIIYALGGIPAFDDEYPDNTGAHPYSLSAFTLDGALLWYRKAYNAGLRTKVLDEVEGTYWSGSYLNPDQIGIKGSYLKVTNDSIIVSGGYSNSYTLGSNPPPGFQCAFVARYDLTGDLIWFQQYLPEGPIDAGTFSDPWGLAIDLTGDIVLFMGSSDGVRPFRIDIEDGSVIP